MFDEIFEFEEKLSDFTGAPYVVATDCCTHAIELCFRYLKIKDVAFTPFTYLSIPMLMHKLNINYIYTQEQSQEWRGEYQFEGTPVWDSARRLERNMYKEGQFQCLSFGHSKPLEIGRGGAILLDNHDAYVTLKEMGYDGRNLRINPWKEQWIFNVGYHYKMTLEEANAGIHLLENLDGECQYHSYPDCRDIKII
jgi:dTDP-4-amino-4,6-dideoxygalactose transaminase